MLHCIHRLYHTEYTKPVQVGHRLRILFQIEDRLHVADDQLWATSHSPQNYAQFQGDRTSSKVANGDISLSPRDVASLGEITPPYMVRSLMQ